MNVTVYTQPMCQPCKLTGMKLQQRNIDFATIRLDLNDEAADRVRSLGYSSAPVVVVDLGDGASWSWQGYRPGEIEKLEKVLSGADPEGVGALSPSV